MQKNKADFASLEGLLQESLTKQHKSKVKGREGRYGVIYTRVSSKEQAENNGSLETQLKNCKEYATRTGIVVKEYFGGIYESAKSDGRKEFQRMLAYVKKDKDITFIIVWNYERFSRTGASAMTLSQSLRGEGIHIKSITEELDTSTASGRMMENFHHIKNFWDNDTKSERTKNMTREVMLKGYWPYMAPIGYQNLMPKHRACNHQYVITEEGKLIKKAFQWKAEGRMSNKAIIDKLALRGMKLSDKYFRWLLSNVFYAGYVTGRLVDHKLIKGHHPPLIDMETFLRANEMLKDARNVGIAKVPVQEALPLKVFAKEEVSLSPLTGYTKKGYWYYKARAIGVGVNIRATELNAKFEEMLKGFEYQKGYYKTLKALLIQKLRKRFEETISETTALKKRFTEVSELREYLEERFILGEIKEALYQKYDAKYSAKLDQIKGEIAKSGFESSNLEMAVEKMLSLAQNLSVLWASSSFVEKQRLQSLVFPEGILYNSKIRAVRTTCVNELFACIPPLIRDTGEKKKGDLVKNRPFPDLVASPRIERGPRASETLILSIVLRGRLSG
ncbi:MAG: hypothetical protein JWP69_243 [Flaviaesturariibacter sp.]|nr:hypothetical protein [Flaviaesturariibacter sp.]